MPIDPLGIALAFNKPIFLVARIDAKLPDVLLGYPIALYENPSDIETQLGKIIAAKVHESDDLNFCLFCNRLCEWMSVPIRDDTFLLLNRKGILWTPIKYMIGELLNKYDLHSADVARIGSAALLCDMRQKVNSCRLVILNIGEPSTDIENYLAFGMAIGYTMPWILILRKGSAIPSYLQDFDRIEYEDPRDLENGLDTNLRGILSFPFNPGGQTKHIAVSPFWAELETWLEYKGERKNYGGFQGEVILAQYDRKKPIGKWPIPPNGLLLGREQTCNVVLQDDVISRTHCRIFKSGKKYYIKDEGSDFGTYINGRKLDPKQPIELHIGDYIRLHEFRFRAWDNRPLPEAQVSTQTSRVNLYRIDIPDIDPPLIDRAYPVDYTTYLDIRLFSEENIKTFEIKEYYTFDRILSVLAPFYHVPESDFCLAWNNYPLSGEESMMTIKNKYDTPVQLIEFSKLVAKVFDDFIVNPTSLQPYSGDYYLTFDRESKANMTEKNIVFIRKEQITKELLQKAGAYRDDVVSESQRIAKTYGDSTKKDIPVVQVAVVTLGEFSNELHSLANTMKISLLYFDQFVADLKRPAKRKPT